MLRLGVDVGGTFTDVVLWDEAVHQATVHKLASTPANPAVAAREGMTQAAELAQATLGDVGQIFHGTTVATNVVIQHAGARVGFITTEGFRDLLHIARHKKPHAFSLFQDLPWQSEPIVPRDLRLTVRERVAPPTGEVLVPLDEDGVADAAARLRDAEVEAIAIGFLFSFLNPEHERRAKEIVGRLAPDVFVCTSSEVIPQFREYERFSTAALNAYVGPSVGAYIRSIGEELGAAGTPRELHLMNSAGGVMTTEGAVERPAALLMSGPVAGMLGGIWAGRLSGIKSVITLDVGGTSADIGVVPAGELRMRHILDSSIAGYHTMMPMAECDSIGAGGGSIAFVDEGGVLRVGPSSAGADPGPVCYGRGGERPTVTDAELILGRLRPEGLLGRTLPLDPRAAAEAIKRDIAQPLSLPLEEAALGIVEIVTEHMVQAIETHSVRKGFDPRDFSLVAIGGAGPLFGCDIAARMGVPRVLVPAHPGLISALGLLTSGLVYEYGATVLRGGGVPDAEELANAFDALEAQARERLDRDAVPPTLRRLQRIADCRYEGQGYELRVDAPLGKIDEDWLDDLITRFHDEHERQYYRSARDRPVQVVTARVRAVGTTAELEWPRLEREAAGEPAGVRDVWFRVDGQSQRLAVPFYEREILGRGQRLRGPAIVHQFESTLVLPPGFATGVDDYGNLHTEMPE